MGSQSIKLKAVIDKEKNRVILSELDSDFIDVLLSFLTMPMGTIIKLTHSQLPTLGCMNNLYASVKNLDIGRFRTSSCKEMLQHPRNGAANHCRYLKLNIDTGTTPVSYFYCGDLGCLTSKHKFSHKKYSRCDCGKQMNGGVFVRGLTRPIISDELELMPASTAASFSLLAKLGIMDLDTIQERTFDVGLQEVLNLLKGSLESKTPLTEILLKQKQVPESRKENLGGGCFREQKIGEHVTDGNTKICILLICSFSFLAFPLGLRAYHSKGCITHLYDSVEELDTEKYFKSNDHKESLLSPKVASGFAYKNQLLGLEEEQYYWSRDDPSYIYSHKPTGKTFTTLTMIDPKAPAYKEATSNGGFVLKPAMFTVTGDLRVTPISPVSGLSILNRLKVPFSDIEEHICIWAMKRYAVRLLMASFISESALTDAFIPKRLKQEQ
ncbi:hypothetical protein MANES_01G165900v8 [Manihot esculenta]|uniref:Uncharacterized protein n=1 Tax=Manihot esculenta TaxID=3983 RepID=A0ACB7IFN5_MANES|nr:hypothetical protein MANES_01G165900v8 [Manihot esculenta]